jgi:putative tryptophan/tyrosine transport system substrate-binding protein
MRRREFIAIVGGATVGWPFAAHTQQSTLPVIGFMGSRSPDESADVVEAFRGGVMEGGVIEGQNAVIEFRWAHGDYGRLPSLAADLVSRRVSVITALGGDPSAIAAKAATSTIPIVFAMSSDPVSAGSSRALIGPVATLRE